MGDVAGRLAAVIHDVAGVDLPLRTGGWEGSEAGPADGPVLIIRSRRALRRLLWAPGELGLARAYISGELDVIGDTADLADGFRRAWSSARLARSRPASGASLTTKGKARAAVAAAKLGVIG